MALPIEFSTLFVRKGALEAAYPGGVDAFHKRCAPSNYLEDEHLVRICFMSTRETLELGAHLDDALSDRPGLGSSYAIVDISTQRPQLPGWLRIGTREDTLCAWYSDEPPGPLISAPRCFSARFFRISWSKFLSELTELNVSVDLSSDPSERESALERGSTRIPVHFGIEDDSKTLFGMMTMPPVARVLDSHAHELLLNDLECVLRRLGWQGAIRHQV